MPLTIEAILQAESKEKPYRLYDADGLYLEVAPSGGKWWRLKYRFGGKEKRISLGVFPEVSLDQARIRRDDARQLVKIDIDPSKQRQIDKKHQPEIVKVDSELKKEGNASMVEDIVRGYLESLESQKKPVQKIAKLDMPNIKDLFGRVTDYGKPGQVVMTRNEQPSSRLLQEWQRSTQEERDVFCHEIGMTSISSLGGGV